MSGPDARFLLGQLRDMIISTTEKMGEDARVGKNAMVILQQWCVDNCSFEEVFNSVRGMLPATAPHRNMLVRRSLQLG